MHKCGQGSIELVDDGDIRALVEGNDSLLRLLQLEISKGVSYLKEFKQKGIPGKIKTFRKAESEEKHISLLNYVRNEYPHFEISIQEKQGSQKRYTLLKWNGEYGSEAKCIVRDNFTEKQSLFIPGRCEDLFWFQSNLEVDKTVSSWEEFGEESFDELESIAF